VQPEGRVDPSKTREVEKGMAAYADFLATFKKVPEPARFKQGGSMNVKLVAVVKSKSDFAFAAQKFKDCLPSLHMRFDTFES